MTDLPPPVAVVAHDAGAANLILAWLAASPFLPDQVRPVMAGPAAALWAARFPEGPVPVTLEAALDEARSLVSGTGWASDLEHEARRRARARGVPSIAVIDHWVNYRMRFQRRGEEILPDRLWVTDDYALAEAARTVAEVPAELKPNLYLHEQVKSAGPVPVNGDILFVLEPARSDWGRQEAGEFQALEWFWRHRKRAVPATTQVRLRPHPSDPPGKYDDWIAAHPGVRLDTSADLAAALRDAAIVVGLQSAALVIALASGREAVTALPPWAPPCVLPHKAISILAGQ